MSRTLNLAEELLSQGRTQQGLGRVRDALTILSRLLRLRELPPGVAEETQARLGEIQLQRRKLTRARRHLIVALRYDPDNAHYHRLLARTLSENEEHWERAAIHFRRALELDPEDTDGLSNFGLLCVKMGQSDDGIAHLKKAVALKPADPEVLAGLVRGLRWSGRQDEARQELRAALFRNARDRRFRQLHDAEQFRQLRRQQLRGRKKEQATPDEEPVLLPFSRSPSETDSATSPVTVHAAEASPVPLPWSLRPSRVHDQRHVQ